MGWISARHMRNGHGLNDNPSKQRKGILRAIVEYKYPEQKVDMFNPPWVILECGHEVQSMGMKKARCAECLKAQQAQQEGK